MASHTNLDDEDDFGGDFAGAQGTRRPGNKGDFGDLEDDIVGFKKMNTEATTQTKMFDKLSTMHLQEMDSFAASFRSSLDSIRVKAQSTVQNKAKLANLKADLRKAEDDFVKVLSVKTCKEAKQMATRDSISATKARIEETKRALQVQRARRDEYATIISQKSLAIETFEEKARQDTECKEETQEAILWYNRVLGFQIDAGHGVKFTFTNIDKKRPTEEYSFTIRHANDTYFLLDCKPQLNNIKELLQVLNNTNDLFRFVRILREKFQEEEGCALLLQSTTIHQDYSTVSLSAPALSVSTDRSATPSKRSEVHRKQKKRLSDSGSASSLRRSSRVAVKK